MNAFLGIIETMKIIIITSGHTHMCPDKMSLLSWVLKWHTIVCQLVMKYVDSATLLFIKENFKSMLYDLGSKSQANLDPGILMIDSSGCRG